MILKYCKKCDHKKWWFKWHVYDMIQKFKWGVSIMKEVFVVLHVNKTCKYTRVD